MATRAELDEWLLRMGAGDRRALSLVYQATSAKLFGIALRILGDRSEAEDALQEIFVKVWLHADRFEVSQFSPITWLSTIARNHAIDRLRHRRSRNRFSASLEDMAEPVDLSPNPEETAVASSLRSHMEVCLGQLDPQRSEVVRRAYLLGETYAELSRRLEVKDATLRTWMRRSLLALRACLEQRGNPDAD